MEYRWHPAMDWGPGLSKEKASQAWGFISLPPDCGCNVTGCLTAPATMTDYPPPTREPKEAIPRIAVCRVFGCSKEKGSLTESTCQADRGGQIAFLSCICKGLSKGWHFAPLSLGLSLLWAMSPSGCECKCKHFNRLVHRPQIS